MDKCGTSEIEEGREKMNENMNMRIEKIETKQIFKK
jgi:hypothetical protein